MYLKSQLTHLTLSYYHHRITFLWTGAAETFLSNTSLTRLASIYTQGVCELIILWPKWL